MVLVPAAPRSGSATGEATAPDAAGQDLLIDRFEATDGEFADFLAASRYEPAEREGFLSHWRRGDGGLRPPPPEERDLPVRHVSLEDAAAFAHWRDKEVPTLEEWMRACPSLRDGALPWRGRALAGACNSIDSGLVGPMPVGSYELGRAPSGCYDVVGNVREWTTTAATVEKAFVVGGSYRQSCEAPVESRSQGSLPWIDAEPPGVRADDLGFRCVIRDAGPVLAGAFAVVEGLGGPARAQAIVELLRVGERTFGENALVPFVREHAFARRVRWSLHLAQGEGAPLRGERVRLLGAPPSLAAGDDLYVEGESAFLRVSRADGAVRQRIDAPLAGAMPQREWLIAPGGAPARWVEGRRGEVALVELPSGRARVAGPAPEGRDVVARWLAGDRGRDGAVWIVQQLDLLEAEPGPPRHEASPRVRVVRIDEAGVHERVVPGEVIVAPAPAGADGLLLVLHHAVEVVLPAGGSRPGRASPRGAARDGAATPFEWASIELLRASDLEPQPRWFVAWETHGVELLLPPARAPLELRWTRYRFAAERGDGVATVEFVAPEENTRLFVPTSRRGSCLVDARLGRWFLVETAAGAIEPPRSLVPPGGQAARLRPLPGGPLEERTAPLLLAEDGSTLFRVREDRAELERVAEGLAIPAALSWSGIDPGGRRLVLRTRDGRWFAIDLERGRLAFVLELPGEVAIDPELLAVDGDVVLACQTTTTSAWLRSTGDGRRLDEFGVSRPSIGKVLAAGSGDRGRPDPLLLFDDGRLVALGPPEAASARLVDDFLGLAHGAGAEVSAAAARKGR